MAQLPGPEQDTDMGSDSPAVSLSMPGSVRAGPQLPLASSASNAWMTRFSSPYVPAAIQSPGAPHEIAVTIPRPDLLSLPMSWRGWAFPQPPLVSSTTNGSSSPSLLTEWPPAAQAPASAQDTARTLALPPLVSGVPGTSRGAPMVPFASLTTNACSLVTADPVNQPPAAQLPCAHDTELIRELLTAGSAP